MLKLTIIDKEGEEHVIEVSPGTNLHVACEEAGVEVPLSCGGGQKCGTCVMTVVQGKIGPPELHDTDLSEPDLISAETCLRLGLSLENQVLSCATQVWGDATVALSESF